MLSLPIARVNRQEARGRITYIAPDGRVTKSLLKHVSRLEHRGRTLLPCPNLVDALAAEPAVGHIGVPAYGLWTRIAERRGSFASFGRTSGNPFLTRRRSRVAK